MDLLATLGLQDDLPEQSTRLSHPGVIATFNNIEEKNNDVRLGFNMCCNCGTKLRVPAEDQDGEKETKPKKPSSKKNHNIVTCKGCNRVKYCSSACLKADADSTPRIDNVDDAQDEAACGHSPVICALLRLCNEDEDAEDEFFNDDDNAGSRKIKSNFQNINPKEEQTKEAAKYRVQTERESYPATLFNLLAESPHWFVDGMTRRLQSMESPIKVRRGKRDRESHSPKKPGQRKSELVLHIVGASVDSELWGWDGSEFNSSGRKKDEVSVMEAYTEASTNLLSFLKQFPILIDSIRFVFVGPDCTRPKTNTGHKTHCPCEIPIPDSNTALVVETHCCNYGENKKQGSTPSLPPLDAIIFFNPEFSCLDYDWSQALSTASSSKRHHHCRVVGRRFSLQLIQKWRYLPTLSIC